MVSTMKAKKQIRKIQKKTVKKIAKKAVQKPVEEVVVENDEDLRMILNKGDFDKYELDAYLNELG